MSLRAITWAFDQHETTPTQRLVLLALADFANQDHQSWPKPETLMQRTGLSRATIFRALSDLKKLELIADDNDGIRDVLTLRLDSQAETPESHSETAESQGENGTTYRNPQGTPNEPSLFGDEDGKPDPAPSKDEAQAVWDHYVSKPGKRVIPLPAQERKVIREALKVATADELCRSIDQCWESDFHMKRGEYRDRDGQVYNKLTQIIKGRVGKETTRERIDYWLERESENAVGAGSGFPSADPAVIARRKQDVQRGHRLKGDDQAVRKAEEAEAWLQEHGIETIRDETPDAYPTFRATAVR